MNGLSPIDEPGPQSRAAAAAGVDVFSELAVSQRALSFACLADTTAAIWRFAARPYEETAETDLDSLPATIAALGLDPQQVSHSGESFVQPSVMLVERFAARFRQVRDLYEKLRDNPTAGIAQRFDCSLRSPVGLKPDPLGILCYLAPADLYSLDLSGVSLDLDQYIAVAQTSVTTLGLCMHDQSELGLLLRINAANSDRAVTERHEKLHALRDLVEVPGSDGVASGAAEVHVGQAVEVESLTRHARFMCLHEFVAYDEQQRGYKSPHALGLMRAEESFFNAFTPPFDNPGDGRHNFVRQAWADFLRQTGELHHAGVMLARSTGNDLDQAGIVGLLMCASASGDGIKLLKIIRPELALGGNYERFAALAETGFNACAGLAFNNPLVPDCPEVWMKHGWGTLISLYHYYPPQTLDALITVLEQSSTLQQAPDCLRLIRYTLGAAAARPTAQQHSRILSACERLEQSVSKNRREGAGDDLTDPLAEMVEIHGAQVLEVASFVSMVGWAARGEELARNQELRVEIETTRKWMERVYTALAE